MKMTVQPEEVVNLKQRLEMVRDTVNGFVRDQRDALRGAPFAEDDVSRDAAKDFAANAETAIQVARQFIDELDRTITGLDQAVTTYNLIDDTHAAAMLRPTGGH